MRQLSEPTRDSYHKTFSKFCPKKRSEDADGIGPKCAEGRKQLKTVQILREPAAVSDARAVVQSGAQWRPRPFAVSTNAVADRSTSSFGRGDL